MEGQGQLAHAVAQLQGGHALATENAGVIFREQCRGGPARGIVPGVAQPGGHAQQVHHRGLTAGGHQPRFREHLLVFESRQEGFHRRAQVNLPALHQSLTAAAVMGLLWENSGGWCPGPWACPASRSAMPRRHRPPLPRGAAPACWPRPTSSRAMASSMQAVSFSFRFMKIINFFRVNIARLSAALARV